MTEFSRPLCPHPRRQARARGFTLVEMMVAVALAVVLLAVGVSPFGQLVARMRIEGVGHNLATDLQLARTEAVQRRAPVLLTVAADGASYTLTSGANVIKTVALSGGAALTANVVITFEPLRGLANAAVMTVTVAGAAPQLRVSSDVMGRVQMCSPDGSFRGYPTC